MGPTRTLVASGAHPSAFPKYPAHLGNSPSRRLPGLPQWWWAAPVRPVQDHLIED
ncbi:hypothetical protein ACIO3O_36405 [Streptomyces sp. NPDC087440]|uniref:hypothetical protein n=1 Tax=Streptomyces sp. NPDC087440 TaxID=3365790 RepID=UPI003819D2A8